MRLLFPECNHVLLAYVLKPGQTGNIDHGEHGASARMLNILTQRVAKNTTVFVTREYEGILLGLRRFLNIKKVAKEALNDLP